MPRNRVREASTQRRDMLSALDTVAERYRCDLATIRATPAGVRRLLSSAKAAELGVRPKRLANVQSCVRKALELYGNPTTPITKRIPLTAEWSALLDLISNEQHRYGLYRLATYASAMGLAPSAIDGEALLGFHAALENEDAVKDPRKRLKQTIALWNMCQRGVPGWPQTVLRSPFKVDPEALPLTAFPPSFQQDVAAWTEWVTHPDIFNPTAPRKPFRPATVEQRVYDFRRFASAVVSRGDLKLDEVTSISVLFDTTRFKSGLRYFLQRAGNKPTAHLALKAKKLLAVAKSYCRVDAAVLTELTQMCRRLDDEIGPQQLSVRNRERLRQFDDQEKVAKLLNFPQEERARGRHLRNPLRAARCMERALAIEILLVCWLRIQNLRTIHLVNNLRVIGKKVFLTFEGHEVKNGRMLDFELPPELAQALAEFRATYRPRLPGASGPYLFPGKDSGARSTSALRNGIEETLRKNAGLVMNPHLFRHALAKIVVEKDPALYPVVSRHLGHSRLSMTMAHYLGTETRAAGRHLDRLLHEVAADVVKSRKK